jgi:hypothetical protein
MLVLDAGDAWQIVLQTDHADLSGQLVRAWGGDGFAPPRPYESVVRAATRHDDGWAVWERAPRLDPEREGPQTFFRVPADVHLAFYRAGVEVVTAEDPYAGLLCSMHFSGLYRDRYGVVPVRSGQLTDELRALADRYVADEEARQAELAELLGVPDDERWGNYALLQTADLLSLYFGLNHLERGRGAEPGRCEDVPTAGGGRAALTIEPLGPWRVRVDPYPFAEDQVALTMVRRLLPKRDWPSDEALRADLAAVRPETVRIYAQR